MAEHQLYVGKWCDPESMAPDGGYALFDPDRLTRHAVCFGMTGSGKTGLCVTLLEELAMGEVPLIVIDPKGDMTNLALAFRNLSDADFARWVDPAEADRAGKSVEDYAAGVASMWRKGLKDWGVDERRIEAFTERTDVTVYTPGSTAGVPVDLLSSLDAPSGDLDDESLLALINGTASGLLGLVDIDADPVTDPEHILLARIIEDSWRAGRSIDLEALILQLVDPPFQKIGVFPVDTFFPRKDRMKLAMTLNGVVASPAFATWAKGASLDPARMLSGDKTPISIFTLSHLDDAQRMFFISMLLNRMVAWSRQQPGSSTLRALVYFDEVFGYLPPYPKNPPVKRPVLTLMKQARAVGLGTMLVTQNPVDVDYAAMSNAGMWWIGRLQTKQDRDRVLDGLAGAAGAIDRSQLSSWLERMPSRTFLVRDVKEKEPRLVHSRWAISYLRGPMTRMEIELLDQDTPEAPAAPQAPPAQSPAADGRAAQQPSSRGAAPAAGAASSNAKTLAPPSGYTSAPTPPPGDIEAQFLSPEVVFSARLSDYFSDQATEARPDGTVVWKPAIYLEIEVLFDERGGWKAERTEHRLFFPIEGEPVLVGEPRLEDSDLLDDRPQGWFAPLPDDLDQISEIEGFARDVRDGIYAGETEKQFRHDETKLVSDAGETAEAFRARVKAALQDAIDEDVRKLKDQVDKKVDRLEDKRRKLERRQSEYQSKASGALATEMVGAGEALFGMFFGRRSSTRVTSAMRRRQQTMKAGHKADQLEEEIGDLDREIYELASEVETQILEIENEHLRTLDDIEEREIGLEKNDIDIKTVQILWVPTTRPM